MSPLPYRWAPDGADHYASIKNIEPGVLIGHEHAIYRVIEKHRKPEDQEWPWRVIIRPVEITGDDPGDRDHDKALKATEHARWFTFTDEHYPICAKCLEPLPCREQMAAKVSKQAAAEFELYAAAAVCPACEQQVAPRQKSKTFHGNLVVPGGPPVTFHLRRKCWYAAMQYEQRWAAAEPGRKVTMSCTGALTEHFDGSRECTEPGCPPGPIVWHRATTRHYPGYSDCQCVAGIEPPRREAPPADPEADRVDQNLLRMLGDE